MQATIKMVKTAVLAGFGSAALGMGLWFSLISDSFFVLTFAFGLLISLPVMVTGFGYGTRAALFSAVLATVFLICGLPLAAALLLAMFFLAPSVFTGWLMGLAQPAAQKGALDWYPLSPALFQLALIMAIATITVMLYLLSSAEGMQYVDTLINQTMAALRDSSLYSAQQQHEIEKSLRGGFLQLLAAALAVYGFFFQVGNLYFSMSLAKKLRLLRRPADNWPAALRMPPAAIVLFAVLAVMNLFAINKTLAICADVIIAALSAGFLIAGLAFIHHATRGRKWRPVVLSILYACLFSIVLTPFFILGLVIIGVITAPLSMHRHNKNKPPHSKSF